MRIAKVLRSVLSPDKYKKYEEMARQRPSGPPVSYTHLTLPPSV